VRPHNMTYLAKLVSASPAFFAHVHTRPLAATATRVVRIFDGLRAQELSRLLRADPSKLSQAALGT